MDWREYRGVFLLALLAGAVMGAGQLGLLKPGGMSALEARLALWWLDYRPYVWMGAAALALFLLAVFGPRTAQRLRERRVRFDSVAQGPTLYLLPRADWKRIKPEDVQVWARLADSLPHDEHISFEIAGSEGEIAFLLHGSSAGVRAAVTQFLAEWPGLFRKPAQPDPLTLPECWSVWWVEISPSSYEQAVRAVSDDPLRAVLVELNAILGQGRGVVQVIASRNYGVKRRLGQKAFAARDEETPSRGVRALRTQEAKELEARAHATYLNVTVRAVGMADTTARAQGIARGLARAIAASFDGNNPVQPVRQGGFLAPVIRREPGKTAAWSANDLAWLAHLAGSDLTQLAPRIATAPARYLPADAEMRFEVGRYRTAFLER